MKTMPVTVQGKSVVPPSVAITRTVLPHGWCSTVVVELARLLDASVRRPQSTFFGDGDATAVASLQWDMFNAPSAQERFAMPGWTVTL